MRRANESEFSEETNLYRGLVERRNANLAGEPISTPWSASEVIRMKAICSASEVILIEAPWGASEVIGSLICGPRTMGTEYG